jgi:hypothetical protein
LEKLSFLLLTWDEVQKLSEKVSDKIKKSGFKPDLIVAVSRGGFDPARIISDQLDIRRLACVQVSYYVGVNMTSDEPKVIHPLNVDVSNFRVLVIDDVADSGESLKLIKKYVNSYNPILVKTATLHYKPWSIYRPDYFAEEVEDWIVYPWEYRETIISISKKLGEEGICNEQLKTRLIEIGFKEDQINRYLII